MKRSKRKIVQRYLLVMISLLVVGTFISGRTCITASAASAKKVVLVQGQKKQLKIRKKVKKAAWKSKNRYIVIVDKKGKIYGRAAGKTVVTAKIGRKIYKYKVAVKRKNVTKKLKNDKYIKKISKDMALYVDAQEHATRKEVLKGYNALSIAAIVAYQHGKYQFTAKEIQAWTYKLVGIKPDTSCIPDSDSPKCRYIGKRYEDEEFEKKPFCYRGGDWGETYPGYKIKKVLKVKKSVYDVEIINLYGEYGANGKGTNFESVGKTTIRIVKNSKSSYKYKVKILKYNINV